MLSTGAVVHAGVTAVREGGLEGLGIRALALRLGVTPMALYRHVPTGEALQEAVIDDILARVPPTGSATEGFAAAARAWATGARPVFAAHAGVARHVLTRWFRLPRALDWVEGLLVAAAQDGMTGRHGVAAVNAVFTYALMRAEAEEAIRRAGVVRRKLPRGRASRARWPLLGASRAEYEVARLDVHFAYGLDVILRGIDRSSRERT